MKRRFRKRFPASSGQNCSHHCPSDAHRFRRGSDRGAEGRHGGGAGLARRAAAIGRHLRPHGEVPDREPELDAGEGINPLAKWGKRSHSVDVSSCPIVIFQCRDNRNDSDPSPFVHFVYHTTILEIKRRNPNPSQIGMMFGFLGFGGAIAAKVELSGESAESISSGMSGKATCDFSPLIL